MFKILGCTTERIKLNNNSITLDKIKLFKVITIMLNLNIMFYNYNF
jgi:hypothetical protein